MADKQLVSRILVGPGISRFATGTRDFNTTSTPTEADMIHIVTAAVETSGAPYLEVEDKEIHLQSEGGGVYSGDGERASDNGYLAVYFTCSGLNGTAWKLEITIDDAEEPAYTKSGKIKANQLSVVEDRIPVSATA